MTKVLSIMFLLLSEAITICWPFFLFAAIASGAGVLLHDDTREARVDPRGDEAIFQ